MNLATEAQSIKTVILKSDLPSVPEALSRLERELVLARKERTSLLKIVHGYGSSGIGGDIRIAVQKRLYDLAESEEIAGCIFGEDWSLSDDRTWRVLQNRPELKNDRDLGRRNEGITIVVLK